MSRIFTLCVLLATLGSGVWASPTGDESLTTGEHGGWLHPGERAGDDASADPEQFQAALDQAVHHLFRTHVALWQTIADNAGATPVSASYQIRAPPFSPEFC